MLNFCCFFYKIIPRVAKFLANKVMRIDSETSFDVSRKLEMECDQQLVIFDLPLKPDLSAKWKEASFFSKTQFSSAVQ